VAVDGSLLNMAAILTSLVGCIIVLALLIKRASRLPIDLPNERSLHVTPTPRIGGLGILAGLGASFILLGAQGMLAITLSALTLAVVSLVDDYFSLPATLRLIAHIGAAILFLALTPFSGWTATLAITFLLVWMTNLFNFMDGADGLAGGMTLIGFGAYGVAAWLGHSMNLALINWAISAAALGFLLFNFPPARVFMGDAGSVPLGFMAGAMGILGWQQRLWPSWFPVLVFSPFVVDATVTLIRRGQRGEKIWQPHRSHYYQRLVRLGMSHRQLALLEYFLMATIAVSAIWVMKYHSARGAELLVGWGVVYLIIGTTIDWHWYKQHGSEF
jgi:UDP-GlcNAc:undecaprenyl-phosphate/decaprenyl-phosphate GlcNAc-1-phosphate transferase